MYVCDNTHILCVIIMSLLQVTYLAGVRGGPVNGSKYAKPESGDEQPVSTVVLTYEN